jgi:hypothetical protein
MPPPRVTAPTINGTIGIPPVVGRSIIIYTRMPNVEAPRILRPDEPGQARPLIGPGLCRIMDADFREHSSRTLVNRALPTLRRSDLGDVLRLGTLPALAHLVAHLLAFLQAPEPGALDAGVVDEEVLTPFVGDYETVALVLAEPLHRALLGHAPTTPFLRSVPPSIGKSSSGQRGPVPR